MPGVILAAADCIEDPDHRELLRVVIAEAWKRYSGLKIVGAVKDVVSDREVYPDDAAKIGAIAERLSVEAAWREKLSGQRNDCSVVNKPAT